MTTTKVKIKMEFRHESLAELLPVGFETELVPVYDNNGELEECSFVATDGNTYTDREIYRFIGLKPLSEIFEKI